MNDTIGDGRIALALAGVLSLLFTWRTRAGRSALRAFIRSGWQRSKKEYRCLKFPWELAKEPSCLAFLKTLPNRTWQRARQLLDDMLKEKGYSCD